MEDFNSRRILTVSDLESPELDCSTHSFKFPQLHSDVPDEKIKQWLYRSPNPATMSALSETHSDDQSLGDSTYEFIDTDEESRDGNATESVASTDLGRPDDVASLADTEQSDESDTEESGIPTFTGLDGPVETPTLGQSAAVFLDDVDTSFSHSIEFEEPGNLGVESISVKHTIADFDEQQTTKIGEHMKLRGVPSRMVATIRQTMTQQCLSTRDPLRILFVGSHEARQDIIHKIASSVAASGDSYSHRGSGSHRSSQLFNVVPVSAFGSGRTPEVELMHSSGYQINVEDVIKATSMKFEDEPNKPDVIKLTLDDNYNYHSVPEGSGFIVEPGWEVPHVAIFYYSDNDTVEMKRTRLLTKTFMSRHKVPSILISHKQLFENSLGCVLLDQHAIHMCLESRIPSGRGNLIHQRLPIDLASFLKVDSRQMNRNLAYLTGLHEPLDASVQATEKIISDTSDEEKMFVNSRTSQMFIQGAKRAPAQLRALRPFLAMGLSAFLAVILGTLMTSYQSTPKGAVTINGNRTVTEPTSTLSTIVESLIPSTSLSLSTATHTSTSTKTITVTKSPSLVPKQPEKRPDSVLMKPKNELSMVPEIAKKVPKEEKPTICTAEVLGDREILIRIPSAAKLSWLSKDTLFMNITRDTEAIQTERIYSTNDGIVLQLSKKDAYGALNLTILSKNKPKINETFVVDFGTSLQREFQKLVDDFATQIAADAKVLDSLLSQSLEYNRRAALSLRDTTTTGLIKAHKLAAQSAAEYRKAAKAVSLDLARGSAIVSKEVGLKLFEAKSQVEKGVCKLGMDLHGPVEAAQVRSKLLWLKLQGKEKEHDEYAARAAKSAKKLADARKKTRSERRTERKAERKARKSKCSGRSC